MIGLFIGLPIGGSLPQQGAAISGTFSGTDGADIAAFAGNVLVQGTFSGVDGADTAAFTGNVLIEGQFSGTDGADEADFTGTVFFVDINGTFSGTDGADLAAFLGNVPISGEIDATDGADTASFLGDIFIEGTFSGTDGADLAEFFANSFTNGTFSGTDGADSAYFEGKNLTPDIAFVADFRKRKKRPDPIKEELRRKKRLREDIELAVYGPPVEYKYEPQAVIQRQMPNTTDLVRAIMELANRQAEAQKLQAEADEESDLELMLTEL